VPSNAPPPVPGAPPGPPKARTLLGIAPPVEASAAPAPIAPPIAPDFGTPIAPPVAPDLGTPIAPPVAPALGAPVDPFAPPPASGPLPPPTDPVIPDAPGPAVDEPDGFGVPTGSRGLKAILHDLRALQPRNKYLVPVVGALAGALVLLILALIVSAIRGKPSEMKTASSSATTKPSTPATTTTPSAPASTSAAPTVAPPPVETPTDTPASASEPALADCAVAGPSHVVAPRAMVSGGLEAYEYDPGLALGFAPTAREGMIALLDPMTLAATSTARGRGLGDVRRVVALPVAGKLTAVVDSDRRADRLGGRRTVVLSPPIDVGVAEGSLVWAPHRKDTYAKLFALGGEGPVESLAVAPLAGEHKGIGVAFRRGNAIWVGVAKGEGGSFTADGGLHRIAGLGTKVGSPTIAASGDRLMIAFADRAAGTEPWQVRTVMMQVGKAPGEAAPFALPDGGLGVQAMSPAAAGMTRGRFLLAWTEGPVSGHQVRAITINPDGSTSGAPLSISAQGINAGAPAAVVSQSGRGVVAFLAVKRKTFEVIATPIECAHKK
ncbi:MAG: hypothetical protein KC657_36225, partial [Myxococcales bacterium]|nr:hypothetical protein [Myxococcales bacterium]